MSRLFHPLLLLIANASEHRLAKHVQHLKEELSILRARIPGEIHTKPEERARLLKFGKPLGKDIDRLISIITPRTFHRWVREERRGYKPAKPARPRKRQVLCELVRKIARETGVGYTRILGELRRLGINRICRQTVRNILKEEGIDTSPKRLQGSWEQFIRIHAKTLWACDFFTQLAIAPRGIVNYFLLVFINVETREIFISNSTAYPDSAWVSQQGRNFLIHTANRYEKPTHLLCDRDSKFTASIDDLHKADGVVVESFAKLVVFCGHGSCTENNPLQVRLDCGTCGCHSGEPNTRFAARSPNQTVIRKSLAERGIAISRETHFVAAFHNATTHEFEF